MKKTFCAAACALATCAFGEIVVKDGDTYFLFFSCTDYRNPDGNGDSMEQMVKRMVEPYDIPVAFDFPVGHVDENMPLIEGAQVTLTVADTVTLQFHA